MGLGLYDAEQNAMAMNTSLEVISPLRTLHNGLDGGAYEVLLHVHNDDPALYYHAIGVEYDPDVGIDSGPLGNTGWSIKFSKGSRQPTEAEWDQVTSGAPISLDDVGAPGDADTSTFFPFWIRVYCPGETPAQLRVGQAVKISYLEDVA